jgi:hypothetical protein
MVGKETDLFSGVWFSKGGRDVAIHDARVVKRVFRAGETLKQLLSCLALPSHALAADDEFPDEIINRGLAVRNASFDCLRLFAICARNQIQ